MNAKRVDDLRIAPPKRARRPTGIAQGGETADPLQASPLAPDVGHAPREVVIYDLGDLLIQLERVYGRPYQFGAECEFGLPQPSLTNEEQVRLDTLRWLADDERGAVRSLLFGSQEMRDRLARERQGCPSFMRVIDLFDRAVALSMLSGAPICVPPIFLLGPPDVGKTHASKAIARGLATAIHAVSCSTNSDAQQLLVGNPTSWRGSRMGIVNEAIVGGTIAQPVLLLDEIDKFESHRDEQPYHVLLNLLEPEKSCAFEGEHLRIHFVYRARA